jgi:type I restriction enzyme S subunit
VNAIAPPLAIAPAHWAVVADILRRLAPDYEVWAFGSRATGRAKPYSDLDLALVSDRPLPLDLTARLAEAFSESDLPWKVDLVDWATTDDAFRGIIMSQRVVVQSARK